MVQGITKNCLFPKYKSFLTLGFKNDIVQMVALTADTHVEPFVEVFHHSHQHVKRNSFNFFLNGPDPDSKI
jgi:hypothetical protein